MGLTSEKRDAAKAISKGLEKEFYTVYRIRFAAVESLFGGLPLDDQSLRGYIWGAYKELEEETKLELYEMLKRDLQIGKDRFPRGELKIADNDEDVKRSDVLNRSDQKDLPIPEVPCGFKRNDIGLHISDYQIKAMLKVSASMLKITTSVRGSKQIFQHGLWIKPAKMNLVTVDSDWNDIPITEPHGYETFAGHITAQDGSKRSILKTCEYVENAEWECDIWVLNTHVLKQNHLEDCLLLGQENGLISCRSFEKGKFEIVGFEKIDPLAKKDLWMTGPKAKERKEAMAAKAA